LALRTHCGLLLCQYLNADGGTLSAEARRLV